MAESTNLGDAIVVVDAQSKITALNIRAAALSGLGTGEGIGRDYKEIFKFKSNGKNEIPAAGLAESAMNSGVVGFAGNAMLVKKNDEEMPVSVSVAPLVDKENKTSGAVIVFQGESEQLSPAPTPSGLIQGDILPITVHELRSPLGGMRWSLEMLMSGDAGQLPEVAQEMVNQIHQNNQKLIGLVNDLLDVWRLDQKNVVVKSEAFDPVAIVNLGCDEARLEAHAKNIEIKSLVRGKQLPKINADLQLFPKVIHNLLSNAIKYSKSGGTVTVDAESTDGFVTISVADQGMGIPKEDQSKIFSKFFRARNAILNEVAGTGLGLFIAKSYTEACGGLIRFESEENKGSTFFVRFPVVQ